MTPTMPSPCMVIRQVSFMDEMPLMARPWSLASAFLVMKVPGEDGLKVFLILIGIFL